MRLTPLLLATVALVAASGCGNDGNGVADAASETSVEPAVLDVIADQPFPDERCVANRDAGTITFLTGSGFDAAASIVDVLMADEAGYYSDLCLDVDVVAGLSSDNYDAVVNGNAQFASGGSFGEMVTASAASGADLVATTVEGRTPIDVLIVPAGETSDVADLAGRRIGVMGSLSPALDVLLRSEGLTAGVDVDIVPLDAADPVAHLVNGIDALAGRKSVEVGALEREGIGVQLFDPLDSAIPGSFGVIFTTRGFVDAHPTAAADFVRATMRGLADAVADPAAASQIALERSGDSADPDDAALERQMFRWQTEAALVLEGTPEGLGLGIPDLAALQAELDADAATGLFADDQVPTATDHVALGLADQIYDGSILIIPG